MTIGANVTKKKKKILSILIKKNIYLLKINHYFCHVIVVKFNI